jgi:hypothetical protein
VKKRRKRREQRDDGRELMRKKNAEFRDEDGGKKIESW